jgi:hypothetical protein
MTDLEPAQRRQRSYFAELDTDTMMASTAIRETRL